MLSRFSDVLQSAADVLAPPATRLEDFEYHWKLILNFYQNYDESSKVHVEETRLPHHFHQMLQLIVEEESEQQAGVVGPCMEAVVRRSVCLVDALAALCGADRPPGARSLALATATALLRRTRRPCVHSARVYRPIQRMLVQCSENLASPTEKEEVELLLTLCGLVRREPGLANIFTTPFIEDKSSLLNIPEDIQKLLPIKTKSRTPKKNPLFEVALPQNPLKNVCIVRNASKDNECDMTGSCSKSDDNGSSKSHRTVCDDNDKFLLMDLLLAYLSSADNQVVLRACEGIMIVSSLPDDDIANLVTSCSPVCETLIDKLVTKYKAIPEDVDPCHVEHLNITWGYVSPEAGAGGERGGRALVAFFSWLDYCDTLVKECHPAIAQHLARVFRQAFLEGALEPALEPGASAAAAVALHTALLAKCLAALDSHLFINELSTWLVGEGQEGGETGEWSLLLGLIDNCLSDDHNLTLASLKFFECMIEKPAEHSLQRLVLCRLAPRLPLPPPHLSPPPPYSPHSTHSPPHPHSPHSPPHHLNDLTPWQERENNREVMKQLQHEEHVTEQISDILAHEGFPTRQGDTPHDIQNVINSYLLLLPRELVADPVGADYENYLHDAHKHYQAWLDAGEGFVWEVVDGEGEGEESALVSALAALVRGMWSRPERVNRRVAALLYRLAIAAPAALLAPPLTHALQDLALKLPPRRPRARHRAPLEEHNQLNDCVVVVEELCKKLAAVAFVKYQHAQSLAQI